MKCYSLVSKVPAGKITTYKDIAKALNSKNYRGVGNAMKLNKNYNKVPCHRVIRTNGSIGEYNLGKDKKKEILISEGHLIKKEKILNYKEKLFAF